MQEKNVLCYVSTDTQVRDSQLGDRMDKNKHVIYPMAHEHNAEEQSKTNKYKCSCQSSD